MFIFQANIAFALALIALAFGVFLIVWMRGQGEHAHKPCKFFAYLIMILAIIALICTSYYATKYWISSCSHTKTTMMQKCKMKNAQKMMKNGKHMMQQQMPMKKMHKK